MALAARQLAQEAAAEARDVREAGKAGQPRSLADGPSLLSEEVAQHVRKDRFRRWQPKLRFLVRQHLALLPAEASITSGQGDHARTTWSETWLTWLLAAWPLAVSTSTLTHPFLKALAPGPTEAGRLARGTGSGVGARARAETPRPSGQLGRLDLSCVRTGLRGFPTGRCRARPFPVLYRALHAPAAYTPLVPCAGPRSRVSCLHTSAHHKPRNCTAQPASKRTGFRQGPLGLAAAVL